MYQVGQIVALLPFDCFSVVRCLELKKLTAGLNRGRGVVFALLIVGFLFISRLYANPVRVHTSGFEHTL